MEENKIKDNDSVEQDKKKESGQDIDPQRDTDKPKH
ncbi:3-methyladenine DNA glycosylase [Bacillus sp. MUM 13]|nr:3-methyladenine DNA glycosylase [Bacillus sp. MUM 13]OIK14531.1 3-methyladenine DNA glycosylase [Bacillus sp. MUM 13]